VSLQPGTRLGSYEITGAVGAGGMGEVFRARDTRLNRDVAIKVMPAAFAQDAERVARFRREAQILASLNHPNVAAIHGLEESDGTLALAMEFVDGEDLAQRLARGAIPVDEALAIARQVADALEEAHEHGIVHRDLKPANVKLTPDGKVKVLDFGLAKALAGDAAASGSGDLSRSPTVTHQGTVAGVILGTAAYMSPEQARGKSVDKRADIWAFGVVLFEMLTGRRLFSGETVSDTLAAILTHEPDWESLPGATPTSVRQLLRRCLERDPKRRLRDIGDARFELDDPRRVSPAPSRSATGWLALALSLALLGALLGTLGARRPAGAPPARVLRLALTLPTGDDWVQQRSRIAVSPDGSRIAFRSSLERKHGLFVRALDDVEPKFIPGSEDGAGPSFSPDGQSVAYFSQPGGKAKAGLSRVRIDGGAPIQVADVGSSAVAGFTFAGDWAEAGQILLAGPTPAIQRVSAAGGAPVAVTALDEARGEATHLQPRLLPDGNGLLYVAMMKDGRLDVMAARGDGSKGTVLIQGASSPRLASTGHLIFERDGALFAASFDARQRRATSEAVSVVEGIKVVVYGHFRQAQYDLAANGTLVYLVDSPSSRAGRLVLVDRGGKAAPVFEQVGAYLIPRVSPEGDRVAYAAINPKTSQREIWIADLKRGTRTRLSLGNATDPIWSADGTLVTYAAVGSDGLTAVFSAPVDGSREPTPLIRGEDRSLALFGRVWLRDGGGLVIHKIGASDDLMLWKPGAVPEPLLATPFNELQPNVSPDGRFIAYVSDESGQREVYVRPLRSASRGIQVSTTGGDSPVWSPRGGEIFYRRGRQMLAVPVGTTASGVSPGQPAVLFEGRFDNDPFNNDATNYDVLKDGQRFVMVSPLADSDDTAARLNVVVNWHEELKAKVPAR
jgi:serine/threonine-protein kinase